MEHDLPRLTNRIANCPLPLPLLWPCLTLCSLGGLIYAARARQMTKHSIAAFLLPTPFFSLFFWRISGQEATATAAASAVSQVAATCGTCCVVQSRQEKRSRAEQERKEEKEKKKMSGACAGVRERKTRSEREGSRGQSLKCFAIHFAVCFARWLRKFQAPPLPKQDKGAKSSLHSLSPFLPLPLPLSRSVCRH